MEPRQAETYTAGNLILKVELQSGVVRCRELPLDQDASEGWVFDRNEIHLVYGDGERRVEIRTVGEPMLGPVEARMALVLPDGEFDVLLDVGACDENGYGLGLEHMTDGSVEGQIACHGTHGDEEVVSLVGSFEATA